MSAREMPVSFPWGNCQYPVSDGGKASLRGRGINVTRFLTGNYVTSLEMAGCSITLSELDAQAAALWDAPVHTAALQWGCE